MKIVRAADQRAMPWKNGGGTTYELAIFPDAASLDDFDWRVSMARVTADGPFSRFPGIDRSLAVLDGHGILLHMAGRGEVAIDRASPPVAFAGELAVSAALRDGPITDLNVMTRRDRWRHTVGRESLDGDHVAVGGAEVTLMIVAEGDVAIRHNGDLAPLACRDALILTQGEEVLLLAAPAADIVRIELWRLP